MARICEIGGFFSKCKNEAGWVCHFCGRRFCETHTHRVEGHEEVCSREPCRKKDADLAVHMQYKGRVRSKNLVGLCGEDDCETAGPFQCSLCRGMFCDKHLQDRRYRFYEGFGSIERPVSICARCWGRRKIWARRR